MSWIFYKQPNGLMTIYSTITDRPEYSNVDKEGYIEEMVKRYRENIEKEAEEIFDDEDPYYVRDFNEMKKQLMYNIKSKESFEKYLRRVGYKGSVDDFRLMHINVFPEDFEQEE